MTDEGVYKMFREASDSGRRIDEIVENVDRLQHHRKERVSWR